jgi:hypothetical protein
MSEEKVREVKPEELKRLLEKAILDKGGEETKCLATNAQHAEQHYQH